MSYQQLADSVNNLAAKTTELTDQALLTQQESIAAKDKAKESASVSVTSAAEAKASAAEALNSANSQLATWAYGTIFRVVSASRNEAGAITTASITWPSGVTGTFTADTFSQEFPGAVDAWHATYQQDGAAKVVTQPAVTRDANGAVILQPAITITNAE